MRESGDSGDGEVADCVVRFGLANGGEFDDSLARCRKHTDAWCQLEGQCVELLANARRGSERARGFITAPFEPPQQQQPAQPVGRCPLCGDAGHSYRQGAYDHPARREITQQCPRVLSDSRPCGLRHAFAGPMVTLCRDGLGKLYRGRQRQALFVAAEASVAASFSTSGQSRVPQGLPQRQQRAQPARRCPLCGDAGHLYRQGAYEHPVDREISQRCTLVLSDGKAYNLIHAFAGPIATPCRDGLECKFYRRP